MFYNFYLVKNNIIANKSTTTKAEEKTSTYLKSLKFQKFFGACLIEFKNNKFLLNKICHIFQQAIWGVKEPH
jgi:hypothetical protein